MTQEAVWN